MAQGRFWTGEATHIRRDGSELRVAVNISARQFILHFRQDAGCDAVQGYVYARPFPAAGIRGWLDGTGAPGLLPAPKGVYLTGAAASPF